MLSHQPPATVEEHPINSRALLHGPDRSDQRDRSLGKSRSSQHLVERLPMRVDLYPMQCGVQTNLSVSQHKSAILGGLQERLVPTLKQAQGSQASILCNTWLLSACTLSALEEAKPLSNSLLALSLILVSDSQADGRLVTESRRHYSQAVQGLQKLIDNELRQHIRQEIRDMSVLTCFACASFEVFYWELRFLSSMKLTNADDS